MSKKGNPQGTTVWPYERKCPECGRVFCVLSVETWIYRNGGTLLCSWGCVRRREERARKRAKDAAEKRRKMLTPTQKEGLIRRYVLQGLNNEEIGKKTGFSAQLVNYYRRRIEKGMTE